MCKGKFIKLNTHFEDVVNLPHVFNFWKESRESKDGKYYIKNFCDESEQYSGRDFEKQMKNMEIVPENLPLRIPEENKLVDSVKHHVGNNKDTYITLVGVALADKILLGGAIGKGIKNMLRGISKRLERKG